ncbi:hypothetical protein ASPZODRAFT_126397 [Penicilliopsis zonata CBS 506.65]|uniref:Uncharacterized protein n=1 Tax=Penicilliopsis zonata CBS 506.65 TaxID=1073090 RepID=A0A1L9STH9_9EURO|nr:hypothetical protein ASPZODRAFT_126397 [Penicilliopsis zonata CBS 506.65]OJJ50510.1 hypothetical protein ASPZODRAFT_126397 [Penicilliopsis zonata CBS 506.65]
MLDSLSNTKTIYNTLTVTELALRSTTDPTAKPSSAIMTPPSPSIPSDGSPRQLRSRPASRRKHVPSRESSSSTTRSRQTPQQTHHHRRVATASSIVSPAHAHSHRRSEGAVSQKQRREDLLALHRESCRLFQEDSHKITPTTMSSPTGAKFPRAPSTITHDEGSRTPSELGSPSSSPLLRAQRLPPPPSITEQSPALEYDHAFLHQNDSDLDSIRRRPDPRQQSVGETQIPSKQQPTATVIDWTSPSTRKREYEKIDRASRGVRGFWRRVAPNWCQTQDARTPFFEQDKDGRGNHEGSVRRFRMDIPDEPETEKSPVKLEVKVAATPRSADRTDDRRKRRWFCL